ncbi:MAG: hypothetical protein ACR2O2_11425 [Ruegeria sp.]
MKLFKLPSGQAWWVVQSLRNGKQGLFHTWELSWSTTPEEARKNVEESDARLDQSLMDRAIMRDDIVNEYEWEPVSRLKNYVSVTEVSSLEEIRVIDDVLFGMLHSHENFALEMGAEGPFVVGGGVAYVTEEVRQ